MVGLSEIQLVRHGGGGEGEDRHLSLDALPAVGLRRSGGEEIVPMGAALEVDLYGANAERRARLAGHDQNPDAFDDAADCRTTPLPHLVAVVRPQCLAGCLERTPGFREG